MKCSSCNINSRYTYWLVIYSYTKHFYLWQKYVENKKMDEIYGKAICMKCLKKKMMILRLKGYSLYPKEGSEYTLDGVTYENNIQL